MLNVAHPSSPHMRERINHPVSGLCAMITTIVCSSKDLKCYHTWLFTLFHSQLLFIFFKWSWAHVNGDYKNSGSLLWLDYGPTACLKNALNPWSKAVTPMQMLGYDCIPEILLRQRFQAWTHSFHWVESWIWVLGDIPGEGTPIATLALLFLLQSDLSHKLW